MKLTFLGVGSAFTTKDYFQSNILLTSKSGKYLLIDCGGDIRHAIEENTGIQAFLGPAFEGVYISHLHADHIGGLEWLAFSTYFNGRKVRPKLFSSEALLKEMWNNTLSGGLSVIQKKTVTLDDYFDIQSIGQSNSFNWQEFAVTLIPLPHVVAPEKSILSYGLYIKNKQNKSCQSVLITTDTQFTPENLNSYYEKADIIFQDCETSPHRSSVHAHYNELLSLPESTKKKMWLYHYQPSPEFDSQKDGFLGFVKKGQIFKFE